MMRRLGGFHALDGIDVVAIAGLLTTAVGVGIVAGIGAALIVIGLAAVSYAIAVSISNNQQPPSQ